MVIIKMAKCLKTYESDSKEWIESFTYIKSIEGLAYIIRMKNQNTGKIDKEVNEICTSNADIIKLRDYLNSLNLGDK